MVRMKFIVLLITHTDTTLASGSHGDRRGGRGVEAAAGVLEVAAEVTTVVAEST